jgi:hypothetical protein
MTEVNFIQNPLLSRSDLISNFGAILILPE